MAASGTTTALAGTTTVTLGGILKTIINAIGSAIKWLFSLPGKLIGLMGINTGATLISLSSTSAITIGEAFNILTALTSVASAIYNAKPYVETRIHEAMAQYSKMLTGLSPRSSMREGIFLSALSKVVDDPTDTKPDLAIDCDFDGELEVGGDPCDSDGDGNTAETVPYFQFWWDMRMREVKKADEVASAGSKGLKKVLEDWQEFIRERVVRTLEWPLVPGYLDRQEIERVDGSIIRFLRVIDTVGLPAATDGGIFGQQGEPVSLVGVPFWEPGPTQDEYDNWKNNHSTLPPDYMKDHGFDEVDYSVDNFKDQAETIAGLVLRVDPLQLWVQGYCVLLRVDPLFIYAFMIPLLYQDPTQPGYDPTKDGSFYKALDRIINGSADFRGMRTWIGSINAVEDVLLECTIDPNTGEPTNENFPCRHTQPTPKHPDYYATTDLDFDDEFVTAREQIQNIIIHTEKFMAYLETLNNAYGPDQFNPVIYEWTDSLGDHKVTVQVSHFVIPGTRTEERGNWWSGEDCVVLKNSSDAKGDNTWVKVRREDTAANTPVGILGFWRNRPIERTAKAPWSIYIVGGGGGGGGGGGTNIQKQ
jgi:hypothetical protein